MRFHLILFLVGFCTLSSLAQDQLSVEKIRQDTLLARQLQDSASIKSVADENEEAMRLLDAAGVLYEQALGKNNKMYAQLLLKQGQLFNIQGQVDSAIAKTKTAMDLLPHIPEEKQALEGLIYYTLGDCFRVKQQYDQAILYQEKALSIWLGALGKNHPNIPHTYNNLAVLYQIINDNNRALEYYEKALKISENIYGEEDYNVILAYNNIGNIYAKLGEYDRAVPYMTKSLAIAIKVFGEDHPFTAEMYLQTANVLYKKGNVEEAISYFQKSQQIRLNVFGEKHPQVADVCYKMASMYYQEKDYDNALAYCEKALVANNFEENQLNKVFDLEYLVNTLQGLGGTYFALYQKNANTPFLYNARQYFVKSADVMDTLRNTFSEGSTKQMILQNNYSIYADILKTDFVLFQQTDSLHYLQEAFQYSSRIKSQLLYEALQEAKALHFAGIPDSLLQQEYDLRLNITYNVEIKEELINSIKSENDSALLAVNAVLLDLQQEYDKLKKYFITNYPDYYKLKYNQSAISATEVQKKLLLSNQALLEYFVGDSSIFVFVIRPDTLVMQEVKKDFPLEDWVKSLRENIYQNRTTGATAYAEAAYNLYQKLILPVKSLLPEQVVIIPDGILGYVPFEALVTAKPERAIRFNSHAYLLKEHQISYCYSATLLREMQQKQCVKAPTGTLLAVAPFYTGDTTLLANLFAYDETTRKDLAPLQHSGEEVYRISKLWKGDVLTGQGATEAQFTAQAGDYRILHLATHGRADERVGDYSFLAFSEIKDSVENELLYVRDLYNMQLNADMVVLSACETGLGKLSRGEGIISLARAFAYAGAKSIVTTLWSVDDAKTKDVMVEFYKNLKKGSTKDAALRQAKLDYLKSHTNPGDAHPFYWAGFAPIGDMRVLR